MGQKKKVKLLAPVSSSSAPPGTAKGNGGGNGTGGAFLNPIKDSEVFRESEGRTESLCIFHPSLSLSLSLSLCRAVFFSSGDAAEFFMGGGV